MSRKGFERHQRKYQAKQQAIYKFERGYKIFGITISNDNGIDKLVNKVTK